MRKKGIRMPGMVAVCLCVVGMVWPVSAQAARPAFIYAEDINQPWVPAQHFTAAWQSVTLASQLYNPLEMPDRTSSRTLSVQGVMTVLDVNGLVGLSMTPRDVLALDQNGKTIYQAPADMSSTRFYRPPSSFGGFVIPGRDASPYPTQHFGFSMPMDPNAGYPTLLGKIQFSTDVLVADSTKRIDIPFVKTTEWAEILPGLEIIVEVASVQGTSYSYRIKARYDSKDVQYAAGSTIIAWEGVPLPKAALIQMEVLNDQGISVRSASSGYAGSSSSSSSTVNGLTTTTLTGSGSCSACGAAATIRQTFVIDPYEKEVTFTLENIPVPTF